MTAQPLAPSERAYSAHFRGAGHDWLLRWITDASRRVHSAEECYRATGWQIRPRPALRSADRKWGCFEAARASERVEVCQTIVDPNGRSWGDSGSWWWSALLGQSRGPWLEVLMVTPFVAGSSGPLGYWTPEWTTRSAPNSPNAAGVPPATSSGAW